MSVALNKKDRIIWIIFWCLVFIGLMIFFQKYHPLTIFDTDDWTYVKFTRRSGGIFPSTREYNPIKVLPENMSAVAGFFGACVIKFFCGDYVRSLEISYGLFYCITITVYLCMLVAAIAVKVVLNVYERIVLGVFISFVHFLPLVTKVSGNAHFFYGGNTNGLYNYSIPALVNVIAVGFSIIYENTICELDFKKHKGLLIIFVGLIYLAINSNLFCNIIIASYAFCKWIQYIIETRKLFDKGRYYIFILIMWIGSLLFEYNGDRAQAVGKQELDIISSVNQMCLNLAGMNRWFLGTVLMLIALAVIMCFVEKRKHNVTIAVFAGSEAITVLFVILLSSKIDKIYLSYHSVYLVCFVWLMFIAFHGMALLLTANNVYKGLALLVTAVLAISILLGKSTYADTGWGGYSWRTSTAVSQYIIQQYMDAYNSGNTYVEVKVPYFGENGDDFPFTDQGPWRIASDLWWHGMTKYKMDAVFVHDKSVNERFGL